MMLHGNELCHLTLTKSQAKKLESLEQVKLGNLLLHITKQRRVEKVEFGGKQWKPWLIVGPQAHGNAKAFASHQTIKRLAVPKRVYRFKLQACMGAGAEAL